MASSVRNVIFDLGVVLDWNPEQIVARFQPVPELRAALKAALFGHADWRMFDRGTLTESELLDRLQLRVGATRQEVAVILDGIRDSLEKPESVALMRALQGQGTPLYCLSNMPASVYIHLLATFNLRLAETVFVDDLLANIESARQVGQHTVWFKDAAQCRRELDRNCM